MKYRRTNSGSDVTSMNEVEDAKDESQQDDVSIDDVNESIDSSICSPDSVDSPSFTNNIPSEATWWSYGNKMKGGPSPSGSTSTRQNARFTRAGDRMFHTSNMGASATASGGSSARTSIVSRGGAHRGEEVWDLSDSLAELYENEQQRQAAKLQHGNAASLSDPATSQRVDVETWLSADPNNGFVRVYSVIAGSGGGTGSRDGVSRLVPCTTATTSHKIALQLGLSGGSLYVQYAGNSTVRRLEPQDIPLLIQNDFLAGLGYESVAALQAAGVADELQHLVKFCAGKPVHDSTFCRRQLKSTLNVKKGGLLQQWIQRPCAISGTRLLIYKDGSSNDEPVVMQLVKGSVEEVKLKGHDLCLKLTSAVNGEKQIHLSFNDAKLYSRWLRRCKKVLCVNCDVQATDKLPTVADLSICQLEYLPENIFVNDQLAVLNLQHNTLKERPLDEDIYVIGWIEDLSRFRHLRSLNLADNDLHMFPISLCSISTLVQLNLASNKIEEIPSEICSLKKLQELHLHNNHLTSLPTEIVALKRLFILILAFNEFVQLPPVVARLTNVKVSDVEAVIMAGNQIEQLSAETLVELRHAKKIDLRLNRLVLPLMETIQFSLLERLTHLDVRDNRIADLDVTAVRTLEYLNCERNAMGSLLVNGSALRNLFASCNCLERLVIKPKPEWLLQIDVSNNCLELLPGWLTECFFLKKLTASKNFLTELPQRMLTAKKLKTLRVDNNILTQLPDEVDCQFLEELYLQHNQITHLPADLLLKANKLRILNVSKNRLTSLPPLNSNIDLNKMQELFLSGNELTSNVLAVVSGYSQLKVLHLAQNELTELYDNEIKKLEMLYELNVSTNQLSGLPPSLCELSQLVVLRAHSNCLRSLPDFHTAKSLRVLDVGHNQLTNVSVTNLMASQISLLDMSLNTELKVDEREYRAVKSKKHVCLVDMTGQNRQLPGLVKKNNLESIDEHLVLNVILPWKVGFSETSGKRNKLCVAILKLLRFNSDNESLFGMFDGGRNSDVPKLVIKHIANVLKEEMKCHETAAEFMKYTMLTMHRKLQSTGQRLGASGVLVHIQRQDGDGQMNHFTMNVANVGDVEAVLCRRGEATMLTRRFVATHDRDECQRICQLDGIITEDGKVNGTTMCTRQIGCAYMYPHIIPEPFVATVTIRDDDEFIVIANGAVWEVMSPEDAVEEIYEIGNPVVAAKHLQDLAQAYGAMENVSVLVIRLNTDRGPSLARLRPNRQAMSVDDVEAAAAHEAAQRARRAARAAATTASTPTVRRRSSYIRTSLGVGATTSFSTSVQSSTTHSDMSGSNESTPTTMTIPPVCESEERSDGISEESKTPTSSFMSSGHTMRMSFSTGDEMDNEDDRSTLTNSSGGIDHNKDDTNSVGGFVRDVNRVEPASSTATSVSQHPSVSNRYVSAAEAYCQETDGLVSGTSNKRPPPIAPKPRFVKKNGGPGNWNSNGGACRDSISRNNSFPVTRKPEFATFVASYDDEEDDERAMLQSPGGVSPSAGVARMVFETEDSSTSIEDHDKANNIYHQPLQQQRKVYPDRPHVLSRTHASDIFARQPPQPNINRQLSQPEAMSFESPPKKYHNRYPAAIPGPLEFTVNRQMFDMNEMMSRREPRDHSEGRSYQHRMTPTSPTSPVATDQLTSRTRFSVQPHFRRGAVVQSQRHGNNPDFEVARFY